MKTQPSSYKNPQPERHDIDWRCPEHAPKPIFTDEPFPAPTAFVGKYVKTALTAVSGDIEHMWVYVDRIDDGGLIGRLANVPFHAHEQGLGRGSQVALAVREIEDVVDGPAPCPVPGCAAPTAQGPLPPIPGPWPPRLCEPPTHTRFARFSERLAAELPNHKGVTHAAMVPVPEPAYLAPTPQELAGE